MSSTRKVPRRAAGTTPGTEATGHRPVLADLVVLLALVGVAEHVVGRADLLEAFLRARVGVRVVLLGQLPVGARDLLVGGRRDDAEHLVVVLLEPLTLGGHGSVHPRTRTMAGRSTCPASGSRNAAPRRPPRRHLPPSVRATASCTGGSKGTSAGRPAPGLPWPGRRAACARRVSALASSLPTSRGLGLVGLGPGRACRAPGAAWSPGAARRRGPTAPPAALNALAVVLEVGLGALEASRYSSRSLFNTTAGRPLRPRSPTAGGRPGPPRGSRPPGSRARR
jgi:hypothetical protein